MTANASQQGHRVLSRRRIAILATVVGLGTAAMYTDHAFGPPTATNALFAPAYAQNVQRPVGFADIVEKVKPAVISVRVKMEAPSDAHDIQLRRRRQPAARLAVRGFLQAFRSAWPQQPVRGAQRAAPAPAICDRPGLGLLHHGRRLRGHQQPRRRQGRERRGHHRRRQELHRQGDRHRSAHRHRAHQGQRPERLPVRRISAITRRGSATGCWRSAIRSASAAP